MKFIDIAKNRYTTKKYLGGRKLDRDIIDQLKEILRMCPSSINSQPWKFTFIEDQELKNQLALSSRHNDERVRNASLIVVFSAMNEVGIFEEHLTKNLPPRALDYFTNNIKPRGEAEIKVWMQHQVCISLGFFLAACASMGLDSTPMEGIIRDDYDKALGITGYRTMFAVAVGFRDPEDENQPTITPKLRRPLEDVITEK